MPLLFWVLPQQPLQFVLNLPFPKRESWEVKEVINGKTLNAIQDGKSRQLQLCGIEIVPNKEQQAQAYLQQLMDDSNNQVAVTVVDRNQDSWLSEVFVSLGEDGEDFEDFSNFQKRLEEKEHCVDFLSMSKNTVTQKSD